MVRDIQDDDLPSDRLPRRDLDVSQLGRRLSQHRWWLIGPTLACLIGSAVLVNIVTPRYTAETKILLENQESYFSGNKVDPQPAPLPDDEAVQSQVQLVSSRDLARTAIRQLGLQGNPEFDPLANGVGPITSLLVLLGLEQDPMRVAPEERMLERYFDRLTVFPVNKSRVLTVEFESKDPDLAARAANTVANLYIDVQGSAKRDDARAAADTLRTLITGLRVKAAEAEDKAQAFRTQTGLVLGTNNNTLGSQQLGDMSTQLAQARSTEADAQAKAKLIRDMIKAGRTIEVPDVINNDLIRRLFEQRANVQAEIALQSRTLLPGHPRMQELAAQLSDFDRQLKAAGEKAARSLDNDARIAASRVDNLTTAMNAQKDVIGAAGNDQVKLNELDLNARLLKDQLELNTSKYQEATARESAVSTPADARIISRAVAPQMPSFPKKLPIIAIATVAGALLSLGVLIAREFLSGRAFVPDETSAELPVAIRTVRPEELETPPAAPTRTPPQVSIARTQGSAADDIADEVTELPDTTLASASDLHAPRDAFITTLDAVLARKEAEQALRVMVCAGESGQATAALAMRLGRVLSRSFRVIAIDACDDDEITQDTLQTIAGYTQGPGFGFGDLLDGRASFAEVIQRDAASRLHFVAGRLTASQMANDEDGLANLLDALAETYDFVLTAGPTLKDARPAPLLLDSVDMVILETTPRTDPDRIAVLKALVGEGHGAPTIAVMAADPNEPGETSFGAAAA